MTWLQRIADKTRPLSEYEKDAHNWQSCALGETNVNIPGVVVKVPSLFGSGRYGDDRRAPVDKILHGHGMAFTSAVEKNWRRAALKHYLAIQARVAHLALGK